jgi:hypothetical protein
MSIERFCSIGSPSIRYPEIQREIQNLLKETEKSLQELPRPPSADPMSETVRLVAAFTRDLAQLVEGTPEGDGLLQKIRPHQYAFRKAIRATAPDFRPYNSNAKGETELQPPTFLSHEEQTHQVSSDADAIYIDYVMDLAHKCVH